MPDESLHSSLLASAEKFAQSALRARLDGDTMVFLLHASTAMELLAKAYLASLSGSLIAANDFDSLLHGSGHSRRAQTPAGRMKTVTASEALRRVAHVEPAFPGGPSLQLLMEVRNSVVHAGLAEAGADEKVLVPFLRACDFLLEKVPGADRMRMWGNLTSSVDARLSESAKEAELLVTDAIAAAKLAYDQRYGSMEDAVREAALVGIESSYNPTKYEEVLIACPACDRLALTAGRYDVDWEPDWDYSDGEVWAAGAFPVVTYWPGYLRCRVCELELDGEEKLAAAGVERTWKLEDVDPADFYEPDDDGR